MKRTAAVILIVLAGCSAPPERIDLLCECFSDAAFAAYRVKVTPEEKPTRECCKSCGGTGRVRSGDGLAWVACPCDAQCPCKSSRGAKCEIRR